MVEKIWNEDKAWKQAQEYTAKGNCPIDGSSCTAGAGCPGGCESKASILRLMKYLHDNPPVIHNSYEDEYGDPVIRGFSW